MTRRSFLTDMLKCGIATTFLPGAGRIWKPTYTPIDPSRLVPFWMEITRMGTYVDANYEGFLNQLYANRIAHQQMIES